MHVSKRNIALLAVGFVVISAGYQNCSPTGSFDEPSTSNVTNSSSSRGQAPYIYDNGSNDSDDNSNHTVITPPDQVPPTLPVVSNSASSPVWRVYNTQNGDHLFTINIDEVNSLVASGTWTLEGIPFSVFSTNGSNLVPMVRCYLSSEGDHFISGQTSCENSSATQEGIMGYMPLVPTGDAIAPLYRCVNTSSPLRHLAVLDTGECSSSGYRVEGILGYVVPPVINVRRVYQASVSKHLFTTNETEARDLISAGWADEGVPFKLMTLRVNDTFRPVYRCYIPGEYDHFVSLDAACEVSEISRQEGLMGYIATHPTGSTQAPLYRCVSTQGALRHLATLNEAECQQTGWRSEGVLGYVAP